MTPPPAAAVDDQILAAAAHAVDEAGGVSQDTVILAGGLVEGIRAANAADVVDALTCDLTWTDLRALAVVLAAMVPADADRTQLLEWVELQPYGWTDATVAREAARWDRGARDFTAARARHERERRAVADGRRP